MADSNPNELLTAPKTGKTNDFWRSCLARALNVDERNAGDSHVLAAFDFHMGYSEKKPSLPQKTSAGRFEVPPPTDYSALYWRRALALVVGTMPDADDITVLSAYETWMEDLKKKFGSPTPGENLPEMRDKRSKGATTSGGRGLPSQMRAELPSLGNEQGRRDFVVSLMNEKRIRGLSYDDAWRAVRDENPKLFSKMVQPGSW